MTTARRALWTVADIAFFATIMLLFAGAGFTGLAWGMFVVLIVHTVWRVATWKRGQA